MAVPSQPRTSNPPGSEPRVRVGVDVGGTLAKLAIARGEGRVDYRLVPANAIERLALEVERLEPGRVGLTGGGALQLSRALRLDTTAVGEFDACGAGSWALLAAQGLASGGRHLLVSLGTGTSIMLARNAASSRSIPEPSRSWANSDCSMNSAAASLPWARSSLAIC